MIRRRISRNFLGFTHELKITLLQTASLIHLLKLLSNPGFQTPAPGLFEGLVDLVNRL
jgi:hypothetical protein